MVRDKRVLAGMSRENVCAIIRWERHRYIDLETGNTNRLDRATLDRLFGLLDFTAEERGLALSLTGFLPSNEEADAAMNAVRPMLAATQQPAYVIDYGWLLHGANAAALTVFGLDEATATSRRNLISLALEPGTEVYERLHSASNWSDFLRAQVASFKLDNSRRLNEKWFVQLLHELMKLDEFAQIWIELEQASLFQLTKTMIVKDFSSITLPRAGTTHSFDSYSMISIPVNQDQRFRLRVLLPTANPLATSTQSALRTR